MTSFLKNVRTVIKNLCLKHQGNYIAVINVELNIIKQKKSTNGKVTEHEKEWYSKEVWKTRGKRGDRNVVFNNEA